MNEIIRMYTDDIKADFSYIRELLAEELNGGTDE